jgi:prepilin-type N-terminal cleavage/methylation domain-containing protein
MHIPRKHLRRSSIRAFTLIEILVASAVMVILVGIVAFIAGSVMDSWNRSSGKLSANAEARLALDLIAQDLETAVLRNNGQQWLSVEGPIGLSNTPPYASNSVTLKLFAPALDRSIGDGICAIAYSLEYQPSYTSTNGPNEYALYRRVIDPSATLNNYLSSGFDDPTADATQQGSLAGNGRPPAVWSITSVTDVSNYLASNIVDFKILIYDTSQALPRNGDANNVVDANYAFGGSGSTAAGLPLYADIILTMVTDQGIDLLNNLALGLVPDGGDLAAAAANVVTQHGETLIRRVYFKSSPI